jgi:hypothetical protein
MRLATVAVISIFAGCLCAQTEQTNTVNLDGTLIDQGCYTTHTQNKETTTNQGVTTTTETTKVTTECPVTTTSSTFALMTPDGKMVRFDDSSNAKVVEMIKSNKDWQDNITGHKPVKVHVVAMPNGDYMVIKEIK